jgi:hypothetical protein
MKITTYLLATVVTAVASITARGEQPVSKPSNSASDTAILFLQHLEAGKTDDALKLWDVQAVNAKLHARVEKMSAKLAGFDGIKKIDVGTCEARRIQTHEKRTGEKIDVVPVEIICRNESLILAVFSFRIVEGQPRIFLLESLKEWGGTASLDEELQYQH